MVDAALIMDRIRNGREGTEILQADRNSPGRTVPVRLKNGNVNATSRVMTNGAILQGAHEEICCCRFTDVEETALNSCTAIIEIRVTSGARNLLEIGRRDKSAGGWSAYRKIPTLSLQAMTAALSENGQTFPERKGTARRPERVGYGVSCARITRAKWKGPRNPAAHEQKQSRKEYDDASSAERVEKNVIENDGFGTTSTRKPWTLSKCKELSKTEEVEEEGKKRRKDGERPASNKKMHLKSKRPKQEGKRGPGCGGEFFGELPHSEWSRVPESRLFVYFRRHGPLHYPYYLSEKFVDTVLGHSRDGTASEPKLKRNASYGRREIENSQADSRKDGKRKRDRDASSGDSRPPRCVKRSTDSGFLNFFPVGTRSGLVTHRSLKSLLILAFFFPPHASVAPQLNNSNDREGFSRHAFLSLYSDRYAGARVERSRQCMAIRAKSRKEERIVTPPTLRSSCHVFFDIQQQTTMDVVFSSQHPSANDCGNEELPCEVGQ
ncbi:hypothetical protein WN48_07716 [Eufriesea mexicana]|uniref:Uncharacterized protein n=1 Tax=Eufriesea mexicana TaxID=516756 RepID=A0A310SW17_9HYME|nr:hypothetical protein WN48_07716 [Eufriesea mexicana]